MVTRLDSGSGQHLGLRGKIVSAVARFRTRGDAKTLEGAPSWILSLLGALAFLIAGYFTMMFATVIPLLIKATNEHALTFGEGVALWGLMAIYAPPVWVFGCLAKRCHELLYKRWFA